MIWCDQKKEGVMAGTQQRSNAIADGQQQAGPVQGLSLILGSTLSVMAMLVLAPVLPQLMAAFRDVPNAEFWVPALVSVAALGAAAFSPFAGFIGDRFGRRIPLVAFCIAFSIFGIAPFFVDDFATLFVSRVAVGIAYTGILVLSTALIGDCFRGEARGRWLGGQAVAATASALLFLPLGGVLGAWLGWRGPFLTFLIGLPFAVAYWALFRRHAEGPEGSESRVGWSALPWRWLLGVCLTTVLTGILAFAVQLQIGLALAAIGITDTARIGLLSGIAFVGIPVGALLFIKVASWPYPRLVLLELAVLGVTLMMMAVTSDYRIFLVVAFVNLIAGGIILPTFLTHAAAHLNDAVRARGIGVWQACFPVSQFLAMGICSVILQRPGSTILDAFWMLGAIGTAAAIVGWFLTINRRSADLRVLPTD